MILIPNPFLLESKPQLPYTRPISRPATVILTTDSNPNLTRILPELGHRCTDTCLFVGGKRKLFQGPVPCARTSFGRRVDDLRKVIVGDLKAERRKAKGYLLHLGIVLVAVDRSPLYYQKFLQTRGLAVNPSLQRLSLLDCYSDPLGWKMKLGNVQIGPENPCIVENVTVFRDIKDIDKLLSIIINLGGGVVGEGKARFSVAIDSASTLLRHASLSSIAKLIASLRSCEKVSSMIWLMHSDLHESRHSVALNYISTMVAILEPMIECANGETSTKNLFGLEKNLVGGKFLVRMKRRNGRVKILNEEFHVDRDLIRFSVPDTENATIVQNLVPKVHFNLHLSEKERADRAKVVLPFEHQGNGEDIKIYDGRHSLPEGKRSHQLDGSVDQGKGEIHYIRDSDDELPDSDEDPDDDLDI